jgi:putative FmdB family regulatory protein
MPTYEYRCKKCGKVFEIFHSISSSVKNCPRCGGELERLITPNAGIIFKGSGFYHTDYKKKEMKTGKKKYKKTDNGNGRGKEKGTKKVEKGEKKNKKGSER